MSKLVISLERISEAYALELAEKFQKQVWGFKVSDLVFQYGAELIYKLSSFGKVIVDVKLHDTSDIIKTNIRNLRAAGAEIITVHVSSNYKPSEEESPHIAGIPLLPMGYDTCELIYSFDEISQKAGMVAVAEAHQYGYIVFYGRQLQYSNNLNAKKIYFDIIPKWFSEKFGVGEPGATPRQALSEGAELIVVGDALTRAENFEEALERTLEEIS